MPQINELNWFLISFKVIILYIVMFIFIFFFQINFKLANKNVNLLFFSYFC